MEGVEGATGATGVTGMDKSSLKAFHFPSHDLDIDGIMEKKRGVAVSPISRVIGHIHLDGAQPVPAMAYAKSSLSLSSAVKSLGLP